MKIFNLAWRNVFRHRRRTIITAAAISVGLAVMIYMDTMMNGLDSLAAGNIIDFETSHLEIFAKGYYREEGLFPLDTIIENPEFILQRIGKIKTIKGVTPRIKFQCRINNGIDELPVLGIGIDIEKESKVFETANTVVRGGYLKNQDDILIGKDLAKDMDLDVGSFLTIITRDQYGTYEAYDFTVSGLINTGHPLLDRNAALMHINIAQRLLSMHGITELCIKTRDDNKLMQLKQEIASEIGKNFEVYTYKELNAGIFEISGMKRSGQFMLALVVVIIAAVGIINTMLMAVMERIPEIGMLKAMGFGNYNIVKMFIYEGGIIGIFGSLFGCFLGLLASFHLVYFGLDLSHMLKDLDMIYPVKFIITGEINYMIVLGVFIFGVVVSVIVTLWPVRKATKLEPVEALRHV
jgi:putative ABC transport system permease protein